MAKIYEFEVRDIDGNDVPMERYRGQVLLIVNTASRCGFTRQYADLQNLFLKHQAAGLRILGFPCNQFGAQEPGSAEDIKAFCETNFKVTFDLFEKIAVNGPKAHPIFAYLADELRGVVGTKAIKWNFTKFLIARDGTPLIRFASTDEIRKIERHVEEIL